MRLPRKWIGIDVIGTSHGEAGIIVHSADGQRVAKPLRRIGMSLGFDRVGEQLFTEVVEAELAGPRQDQERTVDGLQCLTHWIYAPDGTALTLVIWLAEPGQIEPRPIYNSWVLDLEAVTTRSSGDNLTVIGDGRAVGEERPIRHLLQYCNPDDAPRFLALYWDALTGPRGMLAEAFWSIKPPGAATWTHFWSAAHVGIGPDDHSVYGISVELTYRELDTRLATIIEFTDATLLLFDTERQIAVTATGTLARELDEHAIQQVRDQMKLTEEMLADGRVIDQVIVVDGVRYQATAFALPIQQSDRPVTPASVLLKAL